MEIAFMIYMAIGAYPMYKYYDDPTRAKKKQHGDTRLDLGITIIKWIFWPVVIAYEWMRAD